MILSFVGFDDTYKLVRQLTDIIRANHILTDSNRDEENPELICEVWAEGYAEALLKEAIRNEDWIAELDEDTNGFDCRDDLEIEVMDSRHSKSGVAINHCFEPNDLIWE